MTSFFRTKFSEDIFNHKYRHQGCETWDKLADVVVEDVCRENMSRGDKEHLKILITDMKFIPGGRYLFYAGKDYKAFNNCFKGSETFITDQGIKTFQETLGIQVNILSPVSGEFLPAEVEYFGEQDLIKITLAPYKWNGRGKTWTVEATPNHRWVLVNGQETTTLAPGDVVAPCYADLPEVKEAIKHGLVFADGNKHILKNHYGHQLRLCGRKADFVGIFEDDSVTYPEFADGDPVIYLTSPTNLKKLPIGESPSYIASFLQGWLMGDGHFSGVRQIHSINKEAVEFFIENAHLAGYIVTGNIKVETNNSNFGERQPLYRVNFSSVENFYGFRVLSIEQSEKKCPVFCVVEPKHHCFTLAGGIATGNCYLLKCLEDSRQDWASLSWKAESCLMTGGGIGCDYSIYRAKNSPIAKTGGVASGPVSKMRMINEIGREVQQGGGRRSAIYASLNCRHEDIHEFIHAKDWYHMKVSGTDLSIGNLKEMDFNFPAPLDMTNISVNYDTRWLEHYNLTGDVGSVFLDNIKQALSTGEPGFSFNFYNKENETLRNACCEVTSEDDSDVCNLGSINLAKIDTIEEFQEIVELATKFLVCGTLVAELPYAKVYEIRKKNRRLGLGLMGVHEWLLKRGYKYEVSPELHRWLKIYRDFSEASGKEICQRLSISSPVAYRAIAPTGTIGILACSSTGLEPLFAVAYKRRYLKNRRQWVYQYVVDGTAKILIDQFGIAPDKIETALDLASDHERRIKFQADVQDYVDMSISSTINLPEWGSDLNNEDTIVPFAETLAKYAHRIRGFTCYPDGARGGQPLTSVPYEEALHLEGQEFEEIFSDICVIGGKGGSCGV